VKSLNVVQISIR